MNTIGDTDFQSSVDKLPSPSARKINDPKRPWYPSTPNMSDNKTPDPPKATTDYPVKGPRPSGVA